MLKRYEETVEVGAIPEVGVVVNWLKVKSILIYFLSQLFKEMKSMFRLCGGCK